ncbi:MAG TPA: GPW/gp25 family protein [Sporichthyaceae bacterium]|nr:GPW/gp25 family protein [Sporichthyaceae bacterium]
MSPVAEVDFVGAGWAFPVRADATGNIALVRGEREVEQAVRLILGTAPGERAMRPEFGCAIHNHVFGIANPATAGQIAADVRSALQRWEPRIRVEDVQVGFDAVDLGRVHVEVSYTVLGRNDRRNLVFPFYVIPDHEPVPGAGERPVQLPGRS